MGEMNNKKELFEIAANGIVALIGIATFGKVGENTLEKAKEYLKNKEGK
jgi:hypothetical protein